MTNNLSPKLASPTIRHKNKKKNLNLTFKFVIIIKSSAKEIKEIISNNINIIPIWEYNLDSKINLKKYHKYIKNSLAQPFKEKNIMIKNNILNIFNFIILII